MIKILTPQSFALKQLINGRFNINNKPCKFLSQSIFSFSCAKIELDASAQMCLCFILCPRFNEISWEKCHIKRFCSFTPRENFVFRKKAFMIAEPELSLWCCHLYFTLTSLRSKHKLEDIDLLIALGHKITSTVMQMES